MPVSGWINFSTGDKPCFHVGDVITFTGYAEYTEPWDGRDDDPNGPDLDDEPARDVSDEITWRKPAQGTGSTWTHTVTEEDLTHRVFATYYGSEEVASVEVPIRPVCKALVGVSADALALAALLAAEGGTDKGGDDERTAQAYVVVNRTRFKTPPGAPPFPTDVQGVIEQLQPRSTSHQFTSLDDPTGIYWRATDKDRQCLTSEECRLLARMLKIAQKVLDHPDGSIDPILEATGQRAFYFNQSNTISPERSKKHPHPDWTPLLHGKGEDGWTHAFWGQTRLLPRDEP